MLYWEVQVGCCRRLGTDAATSSFTSQSRSCSCDQSKIPVASKATTTLEHATTARMTTTLTKTDAMAMNVSADGRVQPNQSLYIQNLNDKLQKHDLRRALYMLFSTYGPVLDVVALRGKKMRGQAHVLFRDIHVATQAMRACQDMGFFGRPMVSAVAQREAENRVARDGKADDSPENLIREDQVKDTLQAHRSVRPAATAWTTRSTTERERRSQRTPTSRPRAARPRPARCRSAKWYCWTSRWASAARTRCAIWSSNRHGWSASRSCAAWCCRRCAEPTRCQEA